MAKSRLWKHAEGHDRGPGKVMEFSKLYTLPSEEGNQETDLMYLFNSCPILKFRLWKHVEGHDWGPGKVIEFWKLYTLPSEEGNQETDVVYLFNSCPILIYVGDSSEI